MCCVLDGTTGTEETMEEVTKQSGQSLECTRPNESYNMMYSGILMIHYCTIMSSQTITVLDLLNMT